MIFSKDGRRDSAEAALVVVAVGWEAKLRGCPWLRRASRPIIGDS